MHLLNGFRKSTPPQNRRHIVFIGNSKQYLDNFVGELTFSHRSSLPQNLPTAIRSKRAYALAMQLNCRALPVLDHPTAGSKKSYRREISI
jgi:hypothetical protein